VEEDEGEDGGEGGGEDGGGGGGLLPYPRLPFGIFELSPCNLVFLSSNKTFTNP